MCKSDWYLFGSVHYIYWSWSLLLQRVQTKADQDKGSADAPLLFPMFFAPVAEWPREWDAPLLFPPMFLPLFFGPVAEWRTVYSDATKLKGQTLPPIFRTFSPQLKCGSLLSLFSTNEQKTSSELEKCSSHSTLNKVVEYLRLLIKIVTRQIIIMAARSSKIAQCTRLTVLTYHWALSWPKQKVIRHWRRFAAAFFASSHTLSSIT